MSSSAVSPLRSPVKLIGNEILSNARMEEKYTRVKIRLQHQPALRLCSLSFEIDPGLSSCLLKVEATRITFSLAEIDSSLNLNLKNEYSIELAALDEWNDVQWTKDNSTGDCLETSVSRAGMIRLKLASQPQVKIPVRNVEVIPDSTQLELRCKKCELPVTKLDWKFERVLPLPSENWQSLQDMWFCHKHETIPAAHDPDSRESSTPGMCSLPKKDSGNKYMSSGVRPKIGDLLYSNTKLLVHSTAISSDLKVFAGSSSVLCHGCGAIVGHHDADDSVKFHRMNVDLFDSATAQILNSRTPLNLLAKLIREQIAHGDAHCRLILSSESSGDTLLLWMLESDLMVFNNRFHVGSSATIETTVDFEQFHQMLFQCTKRYAPVVQAWSTDLTVCTESVLQSTLETLRDHLLKSNVALQVSDTDNSFDPEFQIGYVAAM